MKRVQLVRHATAGADAFTGLAGEISVDTSRNDIRVHDGSTAGGHRLANLAAIAAAYQPLNAGLTAIAALTTTAFGRSALTLANAAAAQTLFSAQPSNALLTAIAALTTADNKVLAFSGAGSPALTDFMRAAGSWTPGISSSGGAVTSGTVTAGGYYWKFGNLVIATFQYYNATTSGGSGSLLFTGLPFTVLNDGSSAANSMGFILRTSTFNTGAAPHTLSLQPLANTTTLNVVESFDNTVYATTQIGAWANGSELVGCAVYRSAS